MFINKAKALISFCKDHRPLYIYGAGQDANIIINFLAQYQIAVQECIVSRKLGNPTQLRGMRVIEPGEIEDCSERCGVILCLAPQHHNEVKQNLQALKCGSFFPVDENTVRDCLAELDEKPVVVLLYHRVVDLVADPQLLAVSKENFDAQISHIKDYYPVLSFVDDWKHVREPSIVITFDDGYADNFYNALPILQKYQVPATIFVSTQHVDKEEEFWWDDLERMLLINPSLPSSIQISIAGEIRQFTLSDREKVKMCYDKIHPILRDLDFEERKNILTQLSMKLSLAPLARDAYRTMSSQELRALSEVKEIVIGAHTVTHTKLSAQSYERQKYEIETSKVYLETLLQRDMKSFSYPFGCSTDYTQASIEILKKNNFEKAAANFPGKFYSWNSEFEIPRNIVRNWELKMFKEQLNRFLNC